MADTTIGKTRMDLVDKAVALEVSPTMVAALKVQIAAHNLDETAAIRQAEKFNDEALVIYAEIREQVLALAFSVSDIQTMQNGFAADKAAAVTESAKIKVTGARTMFRSWMRVETAAKQVQPFNVTPKESIAREG